MQIFGIPLLCDPITTSVVEAYIDGLIQERCNYIANALELNLSCTNPSIWK